MTNRTWAAITGIVAAVCLAAPTVATNDADQTTTTTTTTTTTAVDPQTSAEEAKSDAQNVWETQACTKTFGAISEPQSLPAHDDGRGCQFALHDWRTAALDLARLSLDDAQQGLDDAHTVFQAAAAALRSAQDDRTAALAAVKASEADLDAAVANLSPPTTTTTTTTTTLPPKPTTTTTTTTTTVPEPTRAEEVLAEWSVICRAVTGHELPPLGEPVHWYLTVAAAQWRPWNCETLLEEWVELGEEHNAG